MTVDYLPLTEAEAQAEKARHFAGIAWNKDRYTRCNADGRLWPCPTIRLLAERGRLREWLIAVSPDTGDRLCVLCREISDADVREPMIHLGICPLAGTGASDD